MSARYDSPLAPEQIAAVRDEDIDFSDIPELDEDFWTRAELVEPDRTDQITPYGSNAPFWPISRLREGATRRE